jgi:hypothetical protein
MYLQKWNEARKAIAEANSVDELSEIANVADSYRYALKQAKQGVEVVNQATEIKLRAERKAGVLLSKIPDASGKRTDLVPAGVEVKTKSKIISKSDITKKQAEKYQELAKIDDGQFEYKIKEIQEEKRELTRQGLIREVNQAFKPLNTTPKEKPRRMLFEHDDPILSVLGNLLMEAEHKRNIGKSLPDFIVYLKHYIESYKKRNHYE